MRRNAASGRSETPAELIARLTAERASSSAPSPASGPDAAVGAGRRHRRADAREAAAVATVEHPAEQDERPVEHDDRPTEQTVAVDVDDVTPLYGTELISGRDTGSSAGSDDPDDPGTPARRAAGGSSRASSPRWPSAPR
jgi:hypothetical protein